MTIALQGIFITTASPHELTRHLYKLFMNSLHRLYMRGRNILLLTIRQLKLLTVAVASRGAARGNQSSRQARDTGRIVK